MEFEGGLLVQGGGLPSILNNIGNIRAAASGQA